MILFMGILNFVCISVLRAAINFSKAIQVEKSITYLNNSREINTSFAAIKNSKTT